MSCLEKQFNGKLKEVFFYITDKCNLKCLHCYMPKAKNKDMPLDIFELMMKELVRFGTSKITFLGGEPTLHPLLPQFISVARKLGIKNIRVDTNGQFNPKLFENSNFKYLNDICFSIDGIDVKTHGAIRSENNYYFVFNNIKKALSHNYVVRVTMTINSLNFSQVEQMVVMLDKLGVSVLNFHLISNSGRARQNKWLQVEENDWIEFYQKITSEIPKHNIILKIPQRYIKSNDVSLKNTITCEAAKASRLAITPDLKVYACPLLLDRERHFALFQDEKFVYNQDYYKNIISEDKVKGPACPLLMEENEQLYKHKEITPLCVSYKPKT
ncbi:MAG: radical SAM protein [Parcubacteria group bacterium]|nr:radical SAM protein [Parcubacteria group bacterium]